MSVVAASEVNADWLTERLREDDLDVVVEEFTATQIGTGQIGKCVRYELTYAKDADNAPRSVVAKFPSDDPVSRATGVALRNFLREVRFYQELQSRVRIRTPHCYFADIVDENGPEFVVLMNDLRPAEQGDQLQGCSPEVAQAAITELAGLHGPTWCDDSLHQLEWLRDADQATPGVSDLYKQQLPAFMDRFAADLADDERAIIEAVGVADHSPLSAEFPEVFSLIHIDYRLDNLMIRDTGDGYEVTAVDWQSVNLGAPLNDVAYFMGAGLLPEVRSEVEGQIVRGYHEALLGMDVHLEWEDCWQAYRRGVFAGFGVTVIAAPLVQQTERGDKMFLTMARRHSRHALDLGAEEFLR